MPTKGSLVVGVLAAVVVGLPLAAILKQNAWTVGWWAVVLLSFALSELIVQRVAHTFFTPIEPPQGELARVPRFTEEVRDAVWNFCAVSSKWLSLWSAPAFSYYLHVNNARALTAYASQMDSPLAKISTEARDKRTFFEQGLHLVDQIAKRRDLPFFFGLRLLVYPRVVYQTHSEEILSLIQTQALGRVHCIPLVLEDLVSALGPGELQAIASFAETLQQALHQNLPPRTRAQRAWEKLTRRHRATPIVPDFLIVNNLVTPSNLSNVWWFTQHGASQDKDAVGTAARVFSILCSRCRASTWTGFTFDTLEAVPVVEQPGPEQHELFFSRPYYEKWLSWIASAAVADAALLRNWLAAEEKWLLENVPRGENVLDVGCGFGRHCELLLNNGVASRVVGVDTSVPMVKRAQRLATRFGPEKFTVYLDDAADLLYCSDKSFDVVICMTNTLGNISRDKQRAALKQMCRVLKPGGHVLISVYNAEEQSTLARRASYEAVGLHVVEDDGALVALEGLRSEHFSRDRLEWLVQPSGLRMAGEAVELDHIGVATILVKPGP